MVLPVICVTLWLCWLAEINAASLRCAQNEWNIFQAEILLPRWTAGSHQLRSDGNWASVLFLHLSNSAEEIKRPQSTMSLPLLKPRALVSTAGSLFAPVCLRSAPVWSQHYMALIPSGSYVTVFSPYPSGWRGRIIWTPNQVGKKIKQCSPQRSHPVW